MNEIIRNSCFLISSDVQGKYKFTDLKKGEDLIINAESFIEYFSGKKKFTVSVKSENIGISSRNSIVGVGDVQYCSVHSEKDENCVCCELVFALPDNSPLILWKMIIRNEGQKLIEPEKITLLETRSAKSESISFADNENLAIFTNGWQSWGLTGVYGVEEAMRQTRLGFIQGPQWINTGTPVPRKAGRYASDFFGVLGDRKKRNGLLLGFLSQNQHFGVLEAMLDNKTRISLWAGGDRAQLDAGESIETDWAVMQCVDLDSPDPLGDYLDAAAALNGVKIPIGNVSGWCSWYEFYQKISAEKIYQNLNSVVSMRANIPLNLFQIDDGFESCVGDWFEFSPGFANGVASLASKITDEGLQPGIWLAPFIIDRRSRLAKDHPDYLLRQENRKLVNTGFNWDGFSTALDLSYPPALEHVCNIIKTMVHKWGFSYLKLDFLYAAAVKGKPHNQKLTRAQILRHAMYAIRRAAGEKTFLLGCGAPLGSVLGIVDGMRIGADVSDDWRTIWKGISIIFRDEPNTPCIRNAIQNTLTRSYLHKRWWLNDPDCLLIRPTTNLTIAEIQSHASVIALTGGMFLLSDDLPNVPAERLRIAEKLLPILEGRPIVLDWFDQKIPSRIKVNLANETGEWCLLGLFNWEDKPSKIEFDLKQVNLPIGEYWVRSFWDREIRTLNSSEPMIFDPIPAHGGVLLAIRKKQEGKPQFLGSDLHFSQGMEIMNLRESKKTLQLDLGLPRRFSGILDLYLINKPKKVNLDNHPMEWDDLGKHIFRFQVEGDEQATLIVEY